MRGLKWKKNRFLTSINQQNLGFSGVPVQALFGMPPFQIISKKILSSFQMIKKNNFWLFNRLSKFIDSISFTIFSQITWILLKTIWNSLFEKHISGKSYSDFPWQIKTFLSFRTSKPQTSWTHWVTKQFINEDLHISKIIPTFQKFE